MKLVVNFKYGPVNSYPGERSYYDGDYLMAETSIEVPNLKAAIEAVNNLHTVTSSIGEQHKTQEIRSA